MMKRFWLLFFTLLSPIFAFAQGAGAGSGLNILNPPAIENGTDLSIGFLQDIFGVVDGVLHGSGSQVMGQMFMVFNAGALILGGIIIIYTMLVSTLNTANEGEMLGKKWSSIWIPVRSTLGIALLLPKATGYSAIQIFMMWAIVQGVGLADSVWDSVLAYLGRGGVIVQQSFAPSQGVATATQNIFRSVACVYGLQDAMQASRQDYIKDNPNKPAPPPVPDLKGTISPIPTLTALGCTGSGDTCTVSFPGKVTNPIPGGIDWSFLEGACGTVSWTTTSKGAISSSTASIDSSEEKLLQESQRTGIQQIVLDMAGPAQQYIDNQFQNFSSSQFQIIPPLPSSYLDSRLFINAAEDYQGITYPVAKSVMSRNYEASRDYWMAGAAKDGWILAGSFYMGLADMNNNANEASFPTLSIDSKKSPTWSTNITTMDKLNQGGTTWNKIPGQLNAYIDTVATQLTTLPPTKDMTAAFVKELLSGTTAIPPTGSINLFIGMAPTQDSTYGGKKPSTPSEAGEYGGIGGTLLDFIPFFGPLIDMVSQFAQLATAQGTNSNPIILLALMGSAMIDLVVTAWIAGAVSAALTTGALGMALCTGEANITGAVLMWIVPFVWAILGVLFVTGATLTFYLPMVPFILFTFGAIGWLIAVVEAMVAAPIVALGITHPEGHEIMGKADPAVLMLVNVFLRPSMMIIGLIAGIILSYVGVWLLNDGFFGAFWNMIISEVTGAAFVFSIPMMMLLYTVIVIAIVNQAFTLINTVPDKVMAWIGHTGAGVADTAGKMMGEAKGGFEGGAKAMGDGAGASAKGAGERKDKRRKGKIKADKLAEAEKLNVSKN